MADAERALGGYSPEAGRNAHEADAPTLIPVPSLLRSLLSDHLDPGYAAAAERRDGRRTAAGAGTGRGRCWPALAVATVFAAAVAQAQSVAPGCPRDPAGAGRQRAVAPRPPPTTSPPAATRWPAQVDAERRSRLEGDARGRQLLGRPRRRGVRRRPPPR